MLKNNCPGVHGNLETNTMVFHDRARGRAYFALGSGIAQGRRLQSGCKSFGIFSPFCGFTDDSLIPTSGTVTNVPGGYIVNSEGASGRRLQANTSNITNTDISREYVYGHSCYSFRFRIY